MKTWELGVVPSEEACAGWFYVYFTLAGVIWEKGFSIDKLS